MVHIVPLLVQPKDMATIATSTYFLQGIGDHCCCVIRTFSSPNSHDNLYIVIFYEDHENLQ